MRGGTITFYTAIVYCLLLIALVIAIESRASLPMLI